MIKIDYLLACTLGVSLLAINQTSKAQTIQSDTDTPEYRLQEIVVTAERREANLQETSISMLAVTSQSLTSMNIFNVQDLALALPQLQVQPNPNSSNTLSLYLRGVGNSDEQVLQDPSVGVYVDGVYLPRNQGLNLDLLNVERIEMLRGPQGTLYGRNATGGAVNIITPEPDDDFQASFTQGIGDKGHRRTVAMVNLPLTQSLAVRFSHGQLKQNGFIKNPAHQPFGTMDRQSNRVDLLWSPSTTVSARYSFDRNAADDLPAYIAAVPLFPINTSRPESAMAGIADLAPNHVDSNGHTLTINWKMAEQWSVKSISAARTIDDSQSQSFHKGLFGDKPLLVTSAAGAQTMHSQEFQLSGHLHSRLSLLAGLYLFEEDASRSAGNLTPANNRRALVFGRDIKNHSTALFARLSWTPDAFADRLTLTGGLRLSDDKRRAEIQRGVEDVSTGVINLNPQRYSGRREFRNATPELVIEYALHDNRFLYAKISQGYKSGGFNARASSVQRFSEGFDDEHLLSTELGFKSEWLQRRLRINSAVFYSDYRDIQLNVQSDPDNIVLSDVLNAGGAAMSGMEIDVSWVISPWLQLDLNCSQLHSNLYDVRGANNLNVADQYRIIGAPKQSCSTSLDMSRSINGSSNLFATIAYRYQSDVFGSSTITAGEYRIAGYGVVNIQAGASVALGSTTLRVASWLRNAGDKHYYLSHFNGGAGRVVPSAIYAAGQSAGVDFTLSFK
ncbi:TonB-dependent receptor [Gammaproteobacteria bacterium LSUCC0112]|nr:TonB-dependent receptor [Gammaproteobacteria bacterium LSUCC0112]